MVRTRAESGEWTAWSRSDDSGIFALPIRLAAGSNAFVMEAEAPNGLSSSCRSRRRT